MRMRVRRRNYRGAYALPVHNRIHFNSNYKISRLGAGKVQSEKERVLSDFKLRLCCRKSRDAAPFLDLLSEFFFFLRSFQILLPRVPPLHCSPGAWQCNGAAGRLVGRKGTHDTFPHGRGAIYYYLLSEVKQIVAEPRGVVGTT